MQAIQIPVTNYQPWKKAKEWEQINKCLLKQGHIPHCLLYNRIIIIPDFRNTNKQRFYLDYGTKQELLLFTAALFFDEDNAPFLLFHRFDNREVLYHFHGH